MRGQPIYRLNGELVAFTKWRVAGNHTTRHYFRTSEKTNKRLQSTSAKNSQSDSYAARPILCVHSPSNDPVISITLDLDAVPLVDFAHLASAGLLPIHCLHRCIRSTKFV
jgi:hypothetical protein